MYAVYNAELDKIIATFTSRVAAEAFCRLADPLYLFLDVKPLPGMSA
jgi:hypothetical protein